MKDRKGRSANRVSIVWGLTFDYFDGRHVDERFSFSVKCRAEFLSQLSCTGSNVVDKRERVVLMLQIWKIRSSGI